MSNCIIRHATIEDVGLIHDAAAATWEPTYREIISQEQIEIMFHDLFDPDVLTKQIRQQDGAYILAEVQGQVHGFAYVRSVREGESDYKLHRLYVHPEGQGSGIGSRLLAWTEAFVQSQGADHLFLNVNRHNSAVDFYRKQGYDIVETVDIPYKQFWLNDYVMKKALR